MASSGHFLGQVVGDWWEKYVIKPQLDVIAKDLGLFADSRFAKRSCRGDKIHWNDTAGNAVDYDFVLELDGNLEKIGTPVAFLESFWRRGARHSKDKARDDTNKLLPMSETYPTARFLAIAACGEFTQPARDYVKSRGIHLFFVPKKSIIQAFKTVGVEIDYDDSATEIDKNRIADKARGILEERTYDLAAKNLIDIVGQGSFKAFLIRLFHPSALSLRKSGSRKRPCPTLRYSNQWMRHRIFYRILSSRIQIPHFRTFMMLLIATEPNSIDE